MKTVAYLLPSLSLKIGVANLRLNEGDAFGGSRSDHRALTDIIHTDSTITLPLLTAYVMNQCQPRPLKRLYDRREEMLEKLRVDYMSAKNPTDKIPAAVAESASEQLATYPCRRLIPHNS